MFCQKCGTKALENADFCNKCGFKLIKEEASKQPNEPVSKVSPESTQPFSSQENIRISDDTEQQTSNQTNDTNEIAKDGSKFDMILTDVGTQKLEVIKVIRELTGLGLKEAKELSENVPRMLKKDVTREDAINIEAQLAQVGAAVIWNGNTNNVEANTIPVISKQVETVPPEENVLSELLDRDIWKERLERFKGLPTIGKVVIATVAVIAVIIIFSVFRMILSSFIAIVVIGAGGYLVYHIWGAKYITQRKYNKESKVLHLPEDMTAQTLFEALNGRLNYPYFKGVRYGENGECIIEGRYSTYPVIFSGNNEAILTCNLDVDDKKVRTVMLEAIAVRQYINKFFNPSLPFDAVKSYNSLKSAEKQRKITATVLSVASTLIIAAIAIEYAVPGTITNFGGSSNDKYVQMVKEGTLNGYPNKTVGKAFDDYMGNAKWESGLSEDGVRFVNVKGKIMYADKKVDAAVQFIVDSDKGTFDYNAFEINGVPQVDLMFWGFLENIYE